MRLRSSTQVITGMSYPILKMVNIYYQWVRRGARNRLPHPLKCSKGALPPIENQGFSISPRIIAKRRKAVSGGMGAVSEAFDELQNLRRAVAFGQFADDGRTDNGAVCDAGDLAAGVGGADAETHDHRQIGLRFDARDFGGDIGGLRGSGPGDPCYRHIVNKS